MYYMVWLKLRRKYHYKEYVVNDGTLRKYYLMYLDKPLYNKILDKLVLLAMIIIVASTVVHFLVIKLPAEVMWILNLPSAVIISVFTLEVIRMYMESQTKKEFIQKHWLDFILVSFLSVYFLVAGAVTILKTLKVFELVPYFYQAKDARVFYKFFKREE